MVSAGGLWKKSVSYLDRGFLVATWPAVCAWSREPVSGQGVSVSTATHSEHLEGDQTGEQVGVGRRLCPAAPVPPTRVADGERP